MDLLWKKESTKNNSMYRDLFTNIKNEFPEYMFFDMYGMGLRVIENVMAKKNSFAVQYRQTGNEKFKDGKWYEAVKKYSESLRYAENNTEDFALALANRSACFFYLKKYKNCLVDIELATKANYPDRLKSKLEKRKADCLELLHSENVIENVDDIKLSYEANKSFPFMANILEIKINDEFGRHIVTKCDIPAGKTVMIDDNFVTRLTDKENLSDTRKYNTKRCITCNKIAMNPIPCVKCTFVMFCNAECVNQNKIHKMDCGGFYHMTNSLDQKYITQSILAAVNMFPTIEDLMDFVEDAITSERNEIPENALDERSKYRMFLKLYSPSKLEHFVAEIYKNYQTSMRLASIRELFNSTLKKRFLMHLVGHHFLMFIFNSFDNQMCVFLSLFNHSCVPNIQDIWIDNRTACITIRSIKKGEQLFLCYMNEDVMKSQNKDHKVEIYGKYGFTCKCAKCENRLVDLNKIERDACFREIEKQEIDSKNKDAVRNMNEKCIKLLNKYQSLPWSRQLEYVSRKLALSLGIYYEL